MYELRGCGAECMGGWYKILDWLDTHLSKNCQVLQVKEKFGTLRVYLSTSEECDFEAENEACKMSAETCEVCGEPGRVVNDRGWLVCRCDKCLNT